MPSPGLKVHVGLGKTCFSSLPADAYGQHGEQKSLLQQAFSVNFLPQVYSLAQKILAPLDDEQQRFSFAEYARAQKGKQLGTLELLTAVPALPSPLCRKCPYARSCPVFVQDEACLFMAKVLDAPRAPVTFERRLKESITLFAAGSTVMTQTPFPNDIEVLLALLVIAVQLELAPAKPNSRIRAAKEGKRTALGRKIPRAYETAEIRARQRDIQARWKALGIPAQPDAPYYPKL